VMRRREQLPADRLSCQTTDPAAVCRAEPPNRFMSNGAGNRPAHVSARSCPPRRVGHPARALRPWGQRPPSRL
jgi:hypothetical protein